MSRWIDADLLAGDVVESLNDNPHIEKIVRRAHITEHNHFMYLISKQPTVYDLEENRATLLDLLAGKWVDTEAVQKALGMSFSECFSLFDFSREASWWSIVGKTEEERARNGQCVITKFRIKGGGGENGTERDTN